MKKLLLYVLLFVCAMSTQQAFAQPCSISGPSSFFDDQTANYSIATASGAGYFWSVTGVLQINGGNTSSGVQVGASGPGSGSVCVTRFRAGAAPCCTCRTITVSTEPSCIVPTSINIQQIEISGQGCPGDNVTFIATLSPSNSNSTNTSYKWEAGVGSVNNTPFFTQTTGPSVVVPTPAFQTFVWVRVTFTSPCDGSKHVALTLVTYENNSGWFLEDAAHQLEAAERSSPLIGDKVEISPNPFKDQVSFQLQIAEATSAQIELYDSKGQVVFAKSEQLQAGHNLIRLDALPSNARGILFYRISTDQKTLTMGQVVRME